MRYEIFAILVSCYLSFIQHALGLTGIQQPLNELGLTLDYSLAHWTPDDNRNPRSPHSYCFTSHITFNGPVSQITVGQMWKIAFTAYDYIEADMSQYQINPNFKPGALTILAWGNEIILASSQKGSNSFTYQSGPNKVLQILQMCQATYLADFPAGSATGHRTQGKCGEEMAAYIYYSLPTTKASKIDLDVQNAVIGTVGYDVRQGKVVKKDPCGPGSISQWGCSYLVNNQRLELLDRNIDPQDFVLGQLAGGVARTDQVQFCGDLRTF
ncbi:hypothetical protein DPV78_011380 [Talaromyces pinophilus]|nr:hypothetical protein DPV78_011380 [Talaromyces pinophilus]